MFLFLALYNRIRICIWKMVFRIVYLEQGQKEFLALLMISWTPFCCLFFSAFCFLLSCFYYTYTMSEEVEFCLVSRFNSLSLACLPFALHTRSTLSVQVGRNVQCQ